MAVYVIIRRKFKVNQPDKLIPLLKELNLKAREQPGYISTSVLQSEENPQDYTVVSVWENDEAWNGWFVNRERKEIQYKIDSLIGERTVYELFRPLL